MVSSKKENKIIFICWLVYTAAYVGRLNYSACLVAIVEDIGITKGSAGLVGSFFFFAYGIGQLINGIFNEKYNSRLVVFSSLILSGLLNLAMPLWENISVMKYIWLLNGACQSVLWSTLVKTVSQFVSDKKMPNAIVILSTTSSAGAFIAYGFSALFVKVLNWKYSFFLAFAVLVISAFIWLIIYGSETPPVIEKKVETLKKSGVKKSLVICIAIIAIAGIANGFIKDGITWVPSLLYERFNVSASLSILLTLFLTVIATVGSGLIKKIHIKIQSHSAINAILFSLTALFCLAIYLLLEYNSIIAILLCFVAICLLMAMVNNVVTSIFPLDKRALVGSGILAGILNTFCYAGSTGASYTLGVVSHKYGWNMVLVIMLIFSVIASLISAVGVHYDKKLLKGGA